MRLRDCLKKTKYDESTFFAKGEEICKPKTINSQIVICRQTSDIITSSQKNISDVPTSQVAALEESIRDRKHTQYTVITTEKRNPPKCGAGPRTQSNDG